MEYPIYNLKGEKTGVIELPQDIFGVKTNSDLLHQVVTSQKSNARSAIANTKTRGEVRGGGKKPWAQKGTGRARHGSTRSPIWIGGGITFGPRSERNFEKKINKKMRRKALLMAISSKVTDSQLMIFEDMTMKEAKTKTIANAISKVSKIAKPKSLFVMNPENRNAWLSSKNCSGSKVISVNNLNVADILDKKFMVISKDELDLIKKNLSKSGSVAE